MASMTPEVAQALWHMNLPWAPIYTDIFYRAVPRGVQELGLEAGAVYDALVERAVPPFGARDAEEEAVERDEHYRLELFRTVLGWRLHRLCSAPAAWPECPGRVAPLEQDETLPRISVVILSYNRLEYLRNTLHAFHQTVEHRNCELVVLDNGSGDGSREFLERALELGLLSRLVLSQTNLGHGRGFNVACAHADPRAALYVKLDSDICPLTAGWESRMLALAQADPRAGVLGIAQVNHQLLRSAPSFEVAGEAVMSWSTWAVGSCMGIPRATFDRLGYFSPPPGITYTWDDVDYWMRALRAGFVGYYLRDVTSAHQTALDSSRYRSAAGARNRQQVRALLRKHARDYDTGASSLSCFPPEYREVSERRSGDRLAFWPATARES